MNRASFAGVSEARGTLIAPTAISAKSTTLHSCRLLQKKATCSPSPTPLARSPRAQARTWCGELGVGLVAKPSRARYFWATRPGKRRALESGMSTSVR